MLERCLGFIDLRILIEYDLLYQLLLSWEMIPSYLPTSAYVVPLFISSDPRELYAADNGWLYNIYIYIYSILLQHHQENVYVAEKREYMRAANLAYTRHSIWYLF